MGEELQRRASQAPSLSIVPAPFLQLCFVNQFLAWIVPRGEIGVSRQSEPLTAILGSMSWYGKHPQLTKAEAKGFVPYEACKECAII